MIVFVAIKIGVVIDKIVSYSFRREIDCQRRQRLKLFNCKRRLAWKPNCFLCTQKLHFSFQLICKLIVRSIYYASNFRFSSICRRSKCCSFSLIWMTTNDIKAYDLSVIVCLPNDAFVFDYIVSIWQWIG